MVCRDDGGGEVGVSVGRDDEAEVHEAAEPDLEVGEDGFDVAKGNFALGAVFALVDFETGFEVGAFVFLEPFLGGVLVICGVVWCVERGKGW